MRSGGVVGMVQEKASCNRKPVPTRHPQPLSQGLMALPAPLTQGSQALRGTKDGSCPFVLRPKRRGFTGGTWFLSPAQTAPGAPFDQTASVAAQSGSLQHCAAFAALGRSRAAPAGEYRRPIFGNSFAGNLWNSRGSRKAQLLWGAVPQWRFRRNARDQEGKAKPRGRRGAGVQQKASSEGANGGFRGAFRPWYRGPPAAFLSTFRRWKVDACPAAKAAGHCFM